MNPEDVCPYGQGEGTVIVHENLVTPDMASDAGYPEMSGMHHSYDYEQCDYCNGEGYVAQVDGVSK